MKKNGLQTSNANEVLSLERLSSNLRRKSSNERGNVRRLSRCHLFDSPPKSPTFYKESLLNSKEDVHVMEEILCDVLDEDLPENRWYKEVVMEVEAL